MAGLGFTHIILLFLGLLLIFHALWLIIVTTPQLSTATPQMQMRHSDLTALHDAEYTCNFVTIAVEDDHFIDHQSDIPLTKEMVLRGQSKTRP
jgi:hypothetical protein